MNRRPPMLNNYNLSALANRMKILVYISKEDSTKYETKIKYLKKS